jgi:hypothetical protein
MAPHAMRALRLVVTNGIASQRALGPYLRGSDHLDPAAKKANSPIEVDVVSVVVRRPLVRRPLQSVVIRCPSRRGSSTIPMHHQSRRSRTFSVSNARPSSPHACGRETLLAGIRCPRAALPIHAPRRISFRAWGAHERQGLARVQDNRSDDAREVLEDEPPCREPLHVATEIRRGIVSFWLAPASPSSSLRRAIASV